MSCSGTARNTATPFWHGTENGTIRAGGFDKPSTEGQVGERSVIPLNEVHSCADLKKHTCFAYGRRLQEAKADVAEFVDSFAQTSRRDVDDVETAPVEAAKGIEERFSRQFHSLKS